MKRRTKFLLAISSTILTFGILMATVGPRHFPSQFKHGQGMENCQAHYNKDRIGNDATPKKCGAKKTETTIVTKDSTTN